MAITLLYCSRSLIPAQGREMERLGAQCVANNRRLDVTGALVVEAGGFFQILEGEAATVDALFATIAADPRHTDVRPLLRAPLASRRFAGWWMRVIDGDSYGHLGRVFRYDRLMAADRRELDRRVSLLQRV